MKPEHHVAAALLRARYERNTGRRAASNDEDLLAEVNTFEPSHLQCAIEDAEAAIRAYEANRPPVHDAATCRVCAEPKA